MRGGRPDRRRHGTMTAMPPGRPAATQISSLAVLLTLAVAAGLLALVAPARADGPTTRLGLAGAPAYAGSSTQLQADLADAAGAPIPGAAVLVERRVDGAWVALATLTTDDAGHATAPATLAKDPADNVFRASYAGDGTNPPAASGEVPVGLRSRTSRLELGGPTSVVDGRAVTLTVRWTAENGEPVAGPVQVLRSLGGRAWRQVGSVRTGDDGRATYRTTPRVDSRWRVRAAALPWVEGAASTVHRVDNLPPAEPVQLPGGAPRPRRALPPQPRATGDGAHVVVGRVPDGVWRRMSGVSWHAGCPVGRSGLRLVRVNYWDYSGYGRRGELVAAASAAGPMGAVFAEMWQRHLPVRAMWRVDRFGWSARSHGGDDYASMAAGNTSAFNCRDVTGRPGVTSPHSYGRALDLNTWENPYRSARGLVPNTWWQSRSHPRVAWRSRTHVVVRLLARHGFRWTYGLGDTQHFDYVGSRARALAAPVPCRRYCD